MAYSERCHDPTTYWDRRNFRCVPCSVEPGYEISSNCGFDDDGGRHEPPLKRCKPNTFNEGNGRPCVPCAPCAPGHTAVRACSSTANTECQEPRRDTTTVPVPVTSQGSTVKQDATTVAASTPAVLWAVPLVLLISIIVFVLSACVMYRKRKRGQSRVLVYNRTPLYMNGGFSPLSAPSGNNDLEEILSPIIRSAPLQKVLDNLDVLEELVILLDPESHGVKNTKHLASHCSFTSTWITYTYSMKDSKSPLKAVLEGLTSRHPDWTVGHLAKLLSHIDRNDAIAVLAKLQQNVIPV